MIKLLVVAAVLVGIAFLVGRRSSAGASAPSPRLGEPPSPQVESFLREGQKIEAIKAYRNQTGCGLKEAKEAVDALQHRLGL